MSEYYLALRNSHIALKRGRTRAMRAIAFVAALLTVAFLFSVARAHHPLGVMAGALS